MCLATCDVTSNPGSLLHMAADEPVSTVLFQQTNVSAFVGERGLGKGELIVSNTGLQWREVDTNADLQVPCRSVVVHAISRDTSAFPEECIYCMTDGSFPLPCGNGSAEDRDNPDEGAEESEHLCELRLVPDDKSLLDAIYAAIVECQSLNPDTDSGDSSDEGEWFDGSVGADGWMQAEPNGHEDDHGGIVLPAPSEFESMVEQQDIEDEREEMDDGQFDDVEDREECL